MAYQKKDLFEIKMIPPAERTPIAGEGFFPPNKIRWKDEEFVLLGVSNKVDLLMMDRFEGDEDVIKANQNGQCHQFIYVNEEAEMFEAVLIQTETKEIYIIAIRTRRKG